MLDKIIIIILKIIELKKMYMPMSYISAIQMYFQYD